MSVQEVRWVEHGSHAADTYTFSYGNGNEKHQLQTGFLVNKGIITAVPRVEFISDRMLYII
jgi:hypothetical protein